MARGGVSDRASRAKTEGAFLVQAQVEARRAKGLVVYPIHIGQPNFEAPLQFLEAMDRCARSPGGASYISAAGNPELREAVAEEYRQRLGIVVDPDNVFPTCGAKIIIQYAVKMTTEYGEGVLVPDLYFPMYWEVPGLLGCQLYKYRLDWNNGFQFDPDEIGYILSQHPEIRLVIVNTPHNPTGSVATRYRLERLAKAILRWKVYLLSDEVYRRILLSDGVEHVSPASFDGMLERTFIMDCMSKSDAVPGFRAGYACVPRLFRETMGVMIVNTNSCVARPIQAGMIAALRNPAVEEIRLSRLAQYRQRRDFVVTGLRGIKGYEPHNPDGTFYVSVMVDLVQAGFASIGDFVTHMLNEFGVAMLPDTAFGGQGSFVRISLASDLEAHLKPSLEALARVMSR